MIAPEFPPDGAALERYAARLTCAEINSSFHRPHQAQTYARWAASVPEDFRFSVKVPRAVTHEAKLVACGGMLAAFLAQAGELGGRLGPLLVQLPPSLAFDAAVADTFFATLRAQFDGAVVIEPRHATWFAPAAGALLVRRRIARVAADPAPHPLAATPGGWDGLRYWRLHGSPRMYFSPYDDQALDGMAKAMRQTSVEAWCVFDNTASGAAIANALSLAGRV